MRSPQDLVFRAGAAAFPYSSAPDPALRLGPRPRRRGQLQSPERPYPGSLRRRCRRRLALSALSGVV